MMMPRIVAKTAPTARSSHTLTCSPGSTGSTPTDRKWTLCGANWSVANQPAMYAPAA